MNRFVQRNFLNPAMTILHTLLAWSDQMPLRYFYFILGILTSLLIGFLSWRHLQIKDSTPPVFEAPIMDPTISKSNTSNKSLIKHIIHKTHNSDVIPSYQYYLKLRQFEAARHHVPHNTQLHTDITSLENAVKQIETISLEEETILKSLSNKIHSLCESLNTNSDLFLSTIFQRLYLKAYALTGVRNKTGIHLSQLILDISDESSTWNQKARQLIKEMN